MTGLQWNYDVLRNYYASRKLNPIIQHLLQACPGSCVWGIGGHSVVLKVAPGIAAKVSLEPGDERLVREQAILTRLLDADPACPYIIQSFLQRDDVIFFELLENGTLHQRLTFVNSPKPIFRWMYQLSLAVAALEPIGYAHGDLNPRNVVFDSEDTLRLIDFDHSLQAGGKVDVGDEPYVRYHNDPSHYGWAGPATEQFALGSLFWYMTRGSELYSELSGFDRVNTLIARKFPSLDLQDPVNRIISNCWEEKYVSVAELVTDLEVILGEEEVIEGRHETINQEEKKIICEKYYREVMALVTAREKNELNQHDA
jgi:serine/threonine protein kinase